MVLIKGASSQFSRRGGGAPPSIIVRDECMCTSKPAISVRLDPTRSQAVVNCGYHAARRSIDVVGTRVCSGYSWMRGFSPNRA
jgi:hypothetical protein